MFRSVFANNSVFNLHFMKISTENDTNFRYENITIVVDNIPLRKHVAFPFGDYRECNQVTIGLWLNWCELVNVAIHACEHFMLTFLLNK